MPLSLKSKLKKFKYNGQITNEEYQDVIEKLVGHDKHLRYDVIDEFANAIKESQNAHIWCCKDMTMELCSGDHCDDCMRIFVGQIHKIAEQLKGV